MCASDDSLSVRLEKVQNVYRGENLPRKEIYQSRAIDNMSSEQTIVLARRTQQIPSECLR